MGNPSRSKDSSIIGGHEVTPTLVAYLVDRYLYDNRFSETRTLFRAEASSFISSSSRLQVPDCLMTLDGIVNDYICLKMQKRTMDQDRMRLVQEQVRVQNLLRGIHAMSAYNASLITPPPPPLVSAPNSLQKTPSTSGFHQYNTPNVMPVPLQGNKEVDFGNYSTSSTSQPPTRKRKGPEAAVGAPLVTRKARITGAKENSTENRTNKIPQADKAANNFSSQTPFDTLASAKNSAANEMIGHGSSVAKCLFNKADLSIPTTSTCLRTPQKSASPGCDKSNSPQKVGAPLVTRKARITTAQDNSTANGTNKIPHADKAATNLSSHKLAKCLFNKADLSIPASSTCLRTPEKSASPGSDKSNITHLKGRLNFDGFDTEMCLEATADLASTSPSELEPLIDLSGLEIPPDVSSDKFTLSELLDDIDVDSEGSAHHCLSQTSNAPIQNLSGSPPESGNKSLEPKQIMSEYTTTVNEVVQEKDMSTQGYDAKTAANSTTQCDIISNKGDHVKGRLNFDGIDTEMYATADLASTSPSGLEPLFDLSELDIPKLGFCNNFPHSELLDGFD